MNEKIENLAHLKILLTMQMQQVIGLQKQMKTV